VAFVDDDDIELFDGDVGVVADGPGLFVNGAAFYFKAGVFVGFVIQLLMGELGIQALDSGDGDFGGVGDAGTAEDVDVVVLGEFAAIVGDDKLFKFILSPNISSVGNESPKRWLIDESGLQLRRLCG